MPELPEVESVRQQLAAEASGRAWESVSAKPSSLFRTPAKEVARRLTGGTLDGVRRRGKVLLLDFGSGWTLLAHLGMSGQVLLIPPAEAPATHRHLTATLDDGRRVVFRDPRRFGFLKLARREEVEGLKELSGLGADPLDAGLTWDRFTRELKKRDGKIKPLLMSQGLFSGIGNVYADEILFRARVQPGRPVRELSTMELKELYHGIRHVLGSAIRHGGTSFDGAFVDLYGRPGMYGASLSVYGREGEPCGRCHTALRLAQVGGRSSTFCPRCQR